MNNILDCLNLLTVIYIQENLDGNFLETIVFLYVPIMVELVPELIYPLVCTDMKSREYASTLYI